MNSLSRREKEKQAHETEIIIAAEKVFSQKGFEETSIEEIAKEAQFTRRTIYQYFVNKEDLYFAVILKGFRQFFSYFEAAINTHNTGFEKISQASLAYYQFFKDFPDIFRLMNYTGYIKKKAENSPKYQEFIKIDELLFREFIRVIEEGKADGSIRKDLETPRGAYSLVFVLTGFFYELSIVGKNFSEYLAVDEEKFVFSTLDLICQAIRA